MALPVDSVRTRVDTHQNMVRSKKWYAENREYALNRQKQLREPRREELNEKQKAYADSLDPDTKKQRARALYEKNRDRILASHKDYYKANREALLKRQKEYQAANKEARAEYNRQYREKNREKLLEKKREYREKNLEEVRARDRLAQLKRHDKYLKYQREYHHRRRHED